MSAPPARLTNEQVTARNCRAAQLTADYDGVITDEDIMLAAPGVVLAWVNAGKFAGENVGADHRLLR